MTFFARCLLSSFAIGLCLSAILIGEKKPSLAWKQLPPLPDEFGLGGPLVGTHDVALIVGGGANFPHGPPWPEGDQPAGDKVWHDRIYVLAPDEETWRLASRLPRPLAYAPVISHASGVYVFGGESYDEERGNHDRAEVVRLTWSKRLGRVIAEDNALPPLPRPTSYHAGAIIGDTVYIAASHARNETSRTLDTKALWSLDITQPNGKWKSLPAWPGPPRYKMALATAPFAADGEPASEQLFLFSGGTWAKGTEGAHDLSKFEYYDDAYRFDPATNDWTRLADLPKLTELRKVTTDGYIFDRQANTWRRPADGEDQMQTDVNKLFDDHPRAAAAAIATSDKPGRILLFSGSTGRYVTMDVRDRPPFPQEVLAYDIQANRWSVAGKMPQAVVTTGGTWWQGEFVIASGEVRPGVRTRNVQALTVKQAER